MEIIISLRLLNIKNKNQVLLIDNKNIDLIKLEQIKSKIYYFADSKIRLYKKNNNISLIHANPKINSRKYDIEGTLYIPINKNKKHNFDYDKISLPINCLISFGEVDSKNRTCLALRAIQNDDFCSKNLIPIVLIGKNYNFLKPLKELANRSKVAILKGYNNILDIEDICPIAIERLEYRTLSVYTLE